MSRSERDATRIVRLWLEEGATAIPDRVLDAVLDQLPATPQRRPSWLAWRTPIMNKFVAVGLGAAAVIVALFIGAQLVGQPNVVGPPAETPLPSSSSPPTPAADGDAPAGELTPGTRYAMSRGGVSFTLAVPTSGWEYDGTISLIGHAGSPEEADVWLFATGSMYGHPERPMTPAVFDDPCAHDSLQTFDPSLAGQAEALASIPGTELISGPSEVTVDSRQGQQVTVAVPDDVGCPNTEFWLVFNAECGAPTIDCSNYPNWLGETIHEWLIDDDGVIFNIRAQVRHPGEASPDLEAEIQQIVDSIQFE
jgi:hypothetical protein